MHGWLRKLPLVNSKVTINIPTERNCFTGNAFVDWAKRSSAQVAVRKGFEMSNAPQADQLVAIFRDTMIALVRRDGPDLSARQLGVFLTCYMLEGPHTVRGLAVVLDVSKPAITRALDRLTEFELVRRKVDQSDRRSVLVQRTAKGTAFLRDLRAVMAEAESHGRKSPEVAAPPRRRAAG